MTKDNYIDNGPNIELVHINLDEKEFLFELLVNGKTIWAYFCSCCGHISLACHEDNSDIVAMYEEDIYEFIYSITG